MKQYHQLMLTEVQNMIARKEVTCEELCRYYLDRIERYGGKNELNCVCMVNENAIAEAKALDASDARDFPLKGAFVLVKDNIDVAGLPTTAGSAALRDHIARGDAPVIGMLKERGAVILGKTNMTEFANFLTQGMPGGFSSWGGQVVSAFAPDKPVSGSSSGSAVAMSAGLCSFAVGTDTSFSVVGCATENGVIGYKPPVGKIPAEGIVPITRHFDSAGFFTASMEDLYPILNALFGMERAEKRPLTLAVNDFGLENVSEEQKARYAKMLAVMEENGCTIVHTEIGNTMKLKELMLRCFAKELTGYLEASGEMMTVDDILAKYREDPARYAPYGTAYLETSIGYMRDADNEREIAEIRADIVRERADAAEKLSGVDACLMTGPTCIMHYAGLPSMSIPFTNGEDGFPRSMILFGTDEEKMLAAAEKIEGLRGGIARSEYMIRP